MRTPCKLLLISIPLGIIACQHQPEPNADQKPDTVMAPKADRPPAADPDTSISDPQPTIPRSKARSEIDSIMSMEVTLPPLLDDKAYDTATVNGFTRIAQLTKGEMKLLASADLLQKNISDIICRNSTDFADILFLVDNTSSMGDDIDAVRQGMHQIIDVLREKKGVRLAIAIYRDKQHDSSDWFAFQNFETDYDSARRFVDGMRLISNDDLPESVYEGFIEAANQNFWRSRTKRVVLIIGDARPKERSEGGEYTMEDMLRKAAESRIRVNFFPLIVTPYSEQYRPHDQDPKPATERLMIEQVYPNPTNGTIYIKMAEEGRYHLTVYTMTGLMVEERYIDDNLWSIDMSRHNDGLYVVRVSDGNNQFHVAKFILKR